MLTWISSRILRCVLCVCIALKKVQSNDFKLKLRMLVDPTSFPHLRVPAKDAHVSIVPRSDSKDHIQRHRPPALLVWFKQNDISWGNQLVCCRKIAAFHMKFCKSPGFSLQICIPGYRSWMRQQGIEIPWRIKAEIARTLSSRFWIWGIICKISLA